MLHIRTARPLVQFFDVVCQTTTAIFILEVLTTTRARSSKSFILCLLHETYLCQSRERTLNPRVSCTHDKHGIISKQSSSGSPVCYAAVEATGEHDFFFVFKPISPIDHQNN